MFFTRQNKVCLLIKIYHININYLEVTVSFYSSFYNKFFILKQLVSWIIIIEIFDIEINREEIIKMLMRRDMMRILKFDSLSNFYWRIFMLKIFHCNATRLVPIYLLCELFNMTQTSFRELISKYILSLSLINSG